MLEHAPVLVVLGPLFGAFVCGLLAMRSPRFARPVALLSCGFGLGAAAALLISVIDGGVRTYALGGWGAQGGIVFRVDGLSAPIVLVVSLIGFLSCWYSGETARGLGAKRGAFYTLFLLLLTGLVGIVVTNDAFNLYVFLEITALSSYALLALGNRRSLVATLHYLLQGSVGASFYLLGVGYLYLMTGTLNMTELAEALPSLYESRAIQAACAMVVIGAGIKMAFFPLGSWLPNAYSSAAPCVAPLIAPLTTKVSVYVMIRMVYSVFSPAYVFGELGWDRVIVWMAVAAIVIGSLWALMQRNLRRMFCWILIAEIGYMVGGAWLGVRAGVTGAAFHLVNDAMMTMVAFCFVDILTHHCKISRIEELDGTFRRMPLTMTAFAILACSMIGIPPTCGFFSKFYLLLGAVQSGNWHFGAALIFASLCNALLFYRIFEHAFFAKSADVDGRQSRVLPPGSREAPAGMVAPTLIGAASLLILGVAGGSLVNGFLLHLPWGGG